ncbi:MAG: hypothetical protein HFG27_13150 [Provencibacterium sp.]|nr:hypothetical protein [Provencibacterium sp.]
MAAHEFGIMDRAPTLKERYERYEPEKYTPVRVEDELLAPLLPQLGELDFFWHSLERPAKGLAYTGITLISPAAMDGLLKILGSRPELDELRNLLLRAKAAGKFVIHFGI